MLQGSASCSELRPRWEAEYTGTSGELWFRLQDWAWGNTMLALQDGLALAVVLNRRPVVLVSTSASPLYGAELSRYLEFFGGARVVDEPDRRFLSLPRELANRTVRTSTVATVAQLRSALQLQQRQQARWSLPGRRKPAAAPIYSRLLFSFDDGVHGQMTRLAREHRAKAAWPSLFLDRVPDCWSLAFVRPSPRLRAEVAPLVSAVDGAIHLRLCNELGWRDSCVGYSSPYEAASRALGCAAADEKVSVLFVASDSASVCGRALGLCGSAGPDS
jgi:hypothetical protein